MKDAMEELKRHAEKKMGMSWDQIMKQADEDTKRQKANDPISKAYKESSKSPKKMYKESMKDLNTKSKKKN